MNEIALLKIFDTAYESARKAQSAGQYNKAKRDYYRAAKAMADLAGLAGSKLKAARIERARRIMAIADGLPSSAPRKAQEPRSSAGQGSGGESADGAAFCRAEIPDVTFDDVIGLDEVKDAIRVKMIYPLSHPEIYAALGKSGGGGVLMYGPPGTGKTMLARAAASEAKAAFFAVKCSDIVSKWVGESERNIAALFDAARASERAVIFFDELDSLFYKRGEDVHNDRRVNELLQQIDGFSGRSEGIMILGATNAPWTVDEAALRPGRFSQKIYVPLPDENARRAMIERALGKTKTAQPLDLDMLARRTDGFSGADIAELIDRATDAPLFRSLAAGAVDGLTAEDMEAALNAVKPSVDEETIARYRKFGE